MDARMRRDLLDCLTQALQRVNGRTLVRDRLYRPPFPTPVFVVAVGKAAEAMALGAADALGDRLAGGLVVSKPGYLDQHRLARLGLEAIVAGHPVPDEGSLLAGTRLRELLSGIPEDAHLLFLLSGGASSLIEALPAGIRLDDLQGANQWLLGSGLPIDRVNAVRKGLSLLKGGGLLGWLPRCSVAAFAISDVPGDDPAVIGSGPLTPSVAPFVFNASPPALPEWLEAMRARAAAERRPPGEGRGVPVEVLACNRDAMEAAARRAESLGYRVHIQTRPLEGDAAAMGEGIGRSLVAATPGEVLIWGGETTVHLPPQPGRGGRNQHLALAAAGVLDGHGAECVILAVGTDGTDGPGEDAGALVDGETLSRARIAGFDPAASLQRADSGRLLEAAGDLVHTGPTGTNVMDLVIAGRAGRLEAGVDGAPAGVLEYAN